MAETAIRHRPHEDAIVLVIGTLFVALGIAFYAKAMLLTGSTVGIALLLSYATGLAFPLLLVAVNLPFFVLGAVRLGWAFTAKTVLAVALVSLFSRLMPLWLEIGHLHPVYGALTGGGLMGIGLLILFRHGMSLGGVSILAYWLQERRGWRAGYVLLGVDALVLAAGLTVLDVRQFALSVAGVVVLGLVVGMNHRPERYVAAS